MNVLKKFFRKDPCKADYSLGRILGSGSFATVKKAVRKKDGTIWAVKIIKKSALNNDDKVSLEREVDIMERLAGLAHPNIVILREIFDTTEFFYMVMELCSGGEVFDRIVEKEKYSEIEARIAVSQVASALSVCHSMNIVHRDLKPENLLYVSPDSDQIKLADFGLANILAEDKALETACGTPGYVAPEILWGGGYDKQVDVWSLGVITYILLCGFPPFYDENQNKLFKKIRSGEYTFPSPYWDQVSQVAKDFVSTLLCVDPLVRVSADDIGKHKWFTVELTDIEATALIGFKENLLKYNAKRKFKAGVMKMQVLNKLNKPSNAPADKTDSSPEQQQQQQQQHEPPSASSTTADQSSSSSEEQTEKIISKPSNPATSPTPSQVVPVSTSDSPP